MKIVNKLSRRRLLQGMGAGAGLLALAACAPVAPGAAPAAGDSATAPSVEGQTILLWSSYSGKNGEAEQALVDRFNEQFAGDVQVDYQVQGSYEETAQAVTRALSAQDAPDVALMSDVWWFKFYLNQT
ncbi:MAG: extracellular solute-binding protein, partial [Caldilineaceae bacterium]|nr:extracellular solute-binding protein [Caldilineaceae bacterium]